MARNSESRITVKLMQDIKASRLFVLGSVIVVLIWLLFIVGAASPWGYDHGFKPSTTEFTVNLSTLVVSMMGAFAVAFTLYWQFKDAREQQVQITQNAELADKNFALANYGYNLQIFMHIENFFLSEKYVECRNRVQSFWLRYNNDGERHRLAVDEEIRELLKESMYDHWTTAGWVKFQGERGEDMKQVFKLLRYFDVISNFEFDETTARAFHFYYVYYRRLIKTVSDIYRTTYSDERMGPRASIMLPRHGWHDLIERMDDKMAKHRLEVPRSLA